MTTVPFVTCDLLDDNPDKELQVVTPCMDGKFLRATAPVRRLAVRLLPLNVMKITLVLKSF